MTLLVLVLLAVVWIAVLVPPWVRSLREGRPGDSISSFRRQLSVLERSTPGSLPAYRRPVGVPTRSMNQSAMTARAPMARRPVGPSSSVRQRRRQVLLMLSAAVLITGSLAVTAGGTFVIINLVFDVLLVGYVMLLISQQRSAAMYGSSVRYHRSAA